ncbi:MAG: GNAT family N-acetyltransferase, partial [Pseudobdellovibrionaceae bacterium]
RLSELQNIQKASHFEILISPPDWDHLMAEADLYFGSGGTVTWERLYLGLPGVVVSVAENQRKIAEDLAKAGLQIYLGSTDSVSYQDCLIKLEAIVKDEPTLEKIRNLGQKTVRPFPTLLLQSLFPNSKDSKLQITRAKLSDSDFLLELRNEDLTRAMSKNTDPVSKEQHENWFSKKLQDSNCRLYVGRYLGKPCGQFRVDLLPDGKAQTSVAIAPEFRGKGLSSQLVAKGCDHFQAEFPEQKIFIAEIKESNVGSIKSFEKARFRKISEVRDESGVYWVLSLNL